MPDDRSGPPARGPIIADDNGRSAELASDHWLPLRSARLCVTQEPEVSPFAMTRAEWLAANNKDDDA